MYRSVCIHSTTTVPPTPTRITINGKLTQRSHNFQTSEHQKSLHFLRSSYNEQRTTTISKNKMMMTRNVPSKSVLSLLIRTTVCTIAITSLSRGVHAQTTNTCNGNGNNPSFDSIFDVVCNTNELTTLCQLLLSTGLDRSMLDPFNTGTVSNRTQNLCFLI